MAVIDRLKEFRKYLKLTQDKIGEILDIGNAAYSSIETGKSGLTQNHLQKLSELGLNIDWLFTGEGTMVRKVGGEIKVGDINNHGNMGDIRMSVGDCEKELELMRNENQYLQRILDEKERTIQLLMK